MCQAGEGSSWVGERWLLPSELRMDFYCPVRCAMGKGLGKNCSNADRVAESCAVTHVVRVVTLK